MVKVLVWIVVHDSIVQEINNHINFIASFQIQNRLQRQLTVCTGGGVAVCSMTRSDFNAVQLKPDNSSYNGRYWTFEPYFPCESEKVSSRSWGREYPRCQIHGSPDVDHF